MDLSSNLAGESPLVDLGDGVEPAGEGREGRDLLRRFEGESEDFLEHGGGEALLSEERDEHELGDGGGVD